MDAEGKQQDYINRIRALEIEIKKLNEKGQQFNCNALETQIKLKDDLIEVMKTELSICRNSR